MLRESSDSDPDDDDEEEEEEEDEDEENGDASHPLKRSTIIRLGSPMPGRVEPLDTKTLRAQLSPLGISPAATELALATLYALRSPASHSLVSTVPGTNPMEHPYTPLSTPEIWNNVDHLPNISPHEARVTWLTAWSGLHPTAAAKLLTNHGDSPPIYSNVVYYGTNIAPTLAMSLNAPNTFSVTTGFTIADVVRNTEMKVSLMEERVAHYAPPLPAASTSIPFLAPVPPPPPSPEKKEKKEKKKSTTPKKKKEKKKKPTHVEEPILSLPLPMALPPSTPPAPAPATAMGVPSSSSRVLVRCPERIVPVGTTGTMVAVTPGFAYLGDLVANHFLQNNMHEFYTTPKLKPLGLKIQKGSGGLEGDAKPEDVWEFYRHLRQVATPKPGRSLGIGDVSRMFFGTNVDDHRYLARTAHFTAAISYLRLFLVDPDEQTPRMLIEGNRPWLAVSLFGPLACREFLETRRGQESFAKVIARHIPSTGNVASMSGRVDFLAMLQKKNDSSSAAPHAAKPAATELQLVAFDPDKAAWMQAPAIQRYLMDCRGPIEPEVAAAAQISLEYGNVLHDMTAEPGYDPFNQATNRYLRCYLQHLGIGDGDPNYTLFWYYLAHLYVTCFRPMTEPAHSKPPEYTLMDYLNVKNV